MKKILVLSILLLTIIGLSAQQSSIIEKVLANSVEEKITSMQELIGFDDAQAQQLRETELNFLLEVNKAEHCFLCKKQKRIEKLKQERDTELQKILERDQYIKYDAIENKRIKKHPLWAK
ncbi:hypothetical protein SAMN05216365_10669 [Porphyromonadaceae bacterium NLAE-zl-C104]|uniref:hypothetical protein n=1 Tax=Proteiniphilum sp. TaxID=1926877 RepID=UPI00089A430E|nr:hypothetical protein [Proteiniphilum sp.]MDY9917826.1 hypothetical protein [Proteiniphilum sp.]SEA17520.1 hypothetical protein SAMN05216331_12328 [Porphyromonadaceae bacterium KH3R12]SFS44115.1 hypothetical protein SAMN05216365_10669 [Porphyromonadaceae bacterium NLAE-zl-C104]